MEVININDFNNKKIKDAEVIKRIIGGEKELFEILIRRNNQKLYRIVRMYFKNEAEVEDVMQNSYLKAYTKLYQFKLEASFSTWLIRIGINEALQRIKENKKQFKESLEQKVIDIQDVKEANPQDEMIEREMKYLLEKAIDKLELIYKNVYVLKEVEGMTSKEVAEALDISIANVKIRLHRAKRMLKENLYQLSNDKSIFEFGFSKCDNITERVMNSL
ncbi:RNA polymerase sigma factor [uncultured Tenacibaculum sp.]|uniref:RNA polymerase sigma factor n=1 Tax=uncultured Tenacibaculum sp. TaxID=174713 RepID=UPI002625C659|nr:RNA polymerase sigma factor [uncultured Tenacibaculum sp.]